MRRSLTLLLAICALCTALVGCSAKSGDSTAPATGLAIPANSPLAKIQIGMTAQQVSTILGMPTNQISYSTGKAWIPWYFGDDVRRTEWSYKGLGRVVFNGGNVFGGGGGTVNRVDYDPNETGVRNP